MNSHYGIYGGQYVSETLMETLHQLEREYEKAKNDPVFQAELKELLEVTSGANLRFISQSVLLNSAAGRESISNARI